MQDVYLFNLFIWFLHVQSYKHIFFVLVFRSASYNILHVLKTAKMKMQLPVIYNHFIDLNNFVEFETGQWFKKIKRQVYFI